jgi:hypothetical protein
MKKKNMEILLFHWVCILNPPGSPFEIDVFTPKEIWYSKGDEIQCNFYVRSGLQSLFYWIAIVFVEK